MIDWPRMIKGLAPAVDRATLPWVPTEVVDCDGTDVQHYAKCVPLINGGQVGDLACEHQCDPECRYWNPEFQKEYRKDRPKTIIVFQEPLDKWM